jgi:cellulose synthase/poly-beta-1,6-N-acetylglucosamine synthase-like glycosyltransferase
MRGEFHPDSGSDFGFDSGSHVISEPHSDLLGQRLLREGIITPEHLVSALLLQRQHGGRIGDILYRIGACNGLALYQNLASQHALPFADLWLNPPDKTLLDADSLGEYLSLSVVPWMRDTATNTVILATVQPDPQVQTWAKRHFPNHQFALTSQRDIDHSLSLLFSHELSRWSSEGLHQTSPEKSARQTISPQQRYWLYTGVFVLLWTMVAAWLMTEIMAGLAVVMSGFYIATLSFKGWLFWRGKSYQPRLQQQQDALPPLEESQLPVYTILVPLYQEARMLPRLLAAIRNLDYPRSLLDVKLVLEADDAATLAAAKALQPEGLFEIIIVPPSLPRTKPKACNYALRFARGEYVAIYDAEDQPDANQLRRVLQYFRASPDEVVCIQCRLNYYNHDDNLLTRLFAVEYAIWFNYMLIGLESLRIPIPLGGTSNHLKLSRLKELGEWDAYNVTEDADLGIRMAVAKYRTLTLNSLTQEEAPLTLGAWLKQRSRWIKGYMQTWLVHMRHPLRLYQSLGGRGFWGFQFFIGGSCLVFLMTPFLMVFCLLAAGELLFTDASWGGMSASGYATSFAFLFGAVQHGAMSYYTMSQLGWKQKKRTSLCFPFYWFLHSFASFRGLWQLITRPHYWDKTEHGLSPLVRIPDHEQQ